MFRSTELRLGMALAFQSLINPVLTLQPMAETHNAEGVKCASGFAEGS
jgi:hypothetical protein